MSLLKRDLERPGETELSEVIRGCFWCQTMIVTVNENRWTTDLQ